MAGAGLGHLPDRATPWCLMTAATPRPPAAHRSGHHDLTDLAETASCTPPPARHAPARLPGTSGRLRPGRPRTAPAGSPATGPPDRPPGRAGSPPWKAPAATGHTRATVPGYVRTGQPACPPVPGHLSRADRAPRDRRRLRRGPGPGRARHPRPGTITRAADTIRQARDPGDDQRARASPARCPPAPAGPCSPRSSTTGPATPLATASGQPGLVPDLPQAPPGDLDPVAGAGHGEAGQHAAPEHGTRSPSRRGSGPGTQEGEHGPPAAMPGHR
jgi:hypothetical protein